MGSLVRTPGCTNIRRDVTTLERKNNVLKGTTFVCCLHIAVYAESWLTVNRSIPSHPCQIGGSPVLSGLVNW